MPSFADTERRATAAIFRRFPNAQGTFQHVGVITPVVANVVFDPASSAVDQFDVIVNRPALLMTPDAAPLTAEGDTIALVSLDSGSTELGTYIVRSVQPLAEGGMQRVTLAKG